MAGLPYEDRIKMHHDTKPYSIDPFNELETPIRERDSLLVKDFLSSYEAISESINERVNFRYIKMGEYFG